MRRTRRLRSLLFSLLALSPLAACDGGEAKEVARPDQMRIDIIRNRAQRTVVRDPALAATDTSLAERVVIARVSLVPDEEDTGQNGPTAPGSRLRLPPVEVRWRMPDPVCGVLHSTTPLDGDSALNWVHRPTRAGLCSLVAEGYVEGQLFDADTGVVQVEPGAITSYEAPPLVVVAVGLELPALFMVNWPRDAYGNDVPEPWPYSFELVAGAPGMFVRDTSVVARSEGFGKVRIRVGNAVNEVELWAIRDLSTHEWHMRWQCYDMALPGGGHADSAHFWMDRARMRYGAVTARGLNLSFRGELHRRTWIRGAPPADVRFGVSRAVAIKPFSLTWHNGQPAQGLPGATGYAGGSLCDAEPEGTWMRFGPASVVRGDSIPPDQRGAGLGILDR